MTTVGLFILGGVVGRMKGGWPGWLKLPKVVKRLMMAACYVLALWLAGVAILPAVLIGVVLPWWGIVMGHGSYMDLALSPGKDNEFFAPVLNVIPGLSETDGPNYVRDFVGMALTGLTLTVPVSIALAFIGYPTWYWVVGVGKALSYAVGWLIQPNDGSRQSPQWVASLLGINGGGTIGEWLWGSISVGMLYVFLMNGPW